MSEKKDFKAALQEIEQLVKTAKKIELADHTLKDGQIVQVDGRIENGALVTIGGEPAPDGEYIMEDDSVFTVVDGVITDHAPSEARLEAELAAHKERLEKAQKELEQANLDFCACQEKMGINFAEEQLEDGTRIFIEPDGEGLWIGGKAYLVDAESGERTEDLAPDGEHVLMDGKMIVIADGVIVEVLTPEEVFSRRLPDMESVISGFEQQLSELKTENETLKTEFADYRQSQSDMAEKTFELLTKLADLPATPSPRTPRNIIKKDSEGEKNRLTTALAAIADKNKKD